MWRTPLLSSIQRVLKWGTGHVEDTALILNPKSIEARYRTCGGHRSNPQSKVYWSEVQDMRRTPLFSSIQRVLKRGTGHVEDTALILNPQRVMKRGTGHVEVTALILNPKGIEAKYRTCGGHCSYPQSKGYWNEVQDMWRTPLLSSIQRVLKRSTGHVEDTALILNPKSVEAKYRTWLPLILRARNTIRLWWGPAEWSAWKMEDRALILNTKSIEARYRTCGGHRSSPQSKEYWSEVQDMWRTPLLSSIQRVL